MTWKLFVKHVYPPFFRELITSGLRFTREVTGFDYRYYKYVNGFIYKQTFHDEQFFNHVFRAFSKDESLLGRYATTWWDQCRILELEAESLSLLWNRLENKEAILGRLHSCSTAFSRLSPYLILPPVAEKILVERINRLIEEKTGFTPDDEQFASYFIALTSPLELSRFAQSQKELLRFASSVLVKKKQWRKLIIEFAQDRSGIEKLPKELSAWLAAYVATYSWMNYEHGYGRDFTASEIANRLGSLLTHEPSPDEKLNRINRDEVSRKRQRTTFYKRHRVSETDRYYVEAMSRYIFVRNYRQETYNIAGVHLRPLLTYLGSLLEMTYDEFVGLTLDEMNKSIMIDDRGIADCARERLGGYALVMEDGSISIYSEHEVEPVLEEVALKMDIRELEGVVGNEGLAEGPAKVVLDKKDFSKVDPGDIVVCSSTSPEFILVLERAAGLAADLGGYTSHQVQASRDLGIPCIIELGVATRIIQDGELVRLDAHKGVLTRLQYPQ